MRKHIFLSLLCVVAAPTRVHAVCASLIKGPIAFDVAQCTAINPEKVFSSPNPKYNFIRDLPPVNRTQFLNTYRGLYLKGIVARSFAVRSGLSPEQGALSGEKIGAFIPPGAGNCTAIQGKRLQAYLDEACCEGGGDAPCLLGSGYVLKKVQILGATSERAGHTSQSKPEIKTSYQQIVSEMANQNFKVAAASLEKLRAQKALDTQGAYLLGLSYRELDQCDKATPVLELIYKRFENSNFWADDETFIRRGTILLARCYAMLGQVDDSVMVLRGFIIEPKKFEKEIQEALRNPDFGGIRTSKQFIDFETAARKAKNAAP